MGVQLDTGGDKKVKPNINVTPLVDVVLVLLIIFMLVIPNVQEGVSIELFQAPNARKDKDPEEQEQEPIIVSVAWVRDSEEVSYHVGEDEISRDALVAEVTRQHEAEPGRALLFRGDTRVEYGKIRDVFHELQNMGFAYIQLAVKAQKESWDE